MKRILALLFALAMVLSCTVFTVTAADSAAATEGAPASFALMDGASVRLDAEQSGLRFETRILTSELDALGSDVTIGTLILPTNLLDGALTVATAGALNLTSKDEGVFLTVDGDYTVFYAAIVDILPQNYARAFSARSYIKVGETYYYSAYSDANNSRSVYGVAVDAWEGSYANNDIVKAYLDKVVVINGSMLLSKTIKGYTSPYAVSYANDTITVTATDGSLVAGDIATMIVDYDGKIFTGGWTIENNTLTAPYKASLNAVETFDSFSRTEAVGEYTNDSIWVRSYSNNSPNSKTGIANGVFQFTKYGVETGYPKILLKGNVASALNAGDYDTLTISMSIRLADGCTGFQRFNFKLSYAYNASVASLNVSTRDSYFKSGSAANNDAATTAIKQFGANDWVDLTMKIDLVNADLSIYVDGEYYGTSSIGTSSLLDSAKTNLSTYFLMLEAGKMDYASKQGIAIDSFSWGVSKSN